MGFQHPMMAEVLECYSELLLRAKREAEAIAMKNRSKAIWTAYGAHLWRTRIQAHSISRHWVERDGSD